VLSYQLLPTSRSAIRASITRLPYDIPGVKLSHVGELCSFDTFLAEYHLTEPALAALAVIVRGADTARLDLAPQAAGPHGVVADRLHQGHIFICAVRRARLCALVGLSIDLGSGPARCPS
jgi:hypothetical protein